MSRLSHLQFHEDQFSFSAGHFTIFSATERETLHGHNYTVGLDITNRIVEEGLNFDYRYYNKKLKSLCEQLNLRSLLPAHSPYLQLEETPDYWIAHFNHQKLPFLKQDVIILPLVNITLEELSYWFLQQLITDQETILKHRIESITVHVFNGPKHSASAEWNLSALNKD